MICCMLLMILHLLCQLKATQWHYTVGVVVSKRKQIVLALMKQCSYCYPMSPRSFRAGLF